MAEVVDKAILQDADYLKALKRIESGINRMTHQAEKEFAGVNKSAHVSGIQIGAISGVVSALTTEFINLGKKAVGALVEIAKEGTQTALDFDVLRSRLLGIFDGSKPAAEEAFNFIQKKSKELGIDLGEVAGAFLPKVESLEQFERVAKIATALARSDPEQGAIGARIALIEALSGTFTSLQRRFEIPKDDINAIKEAFDTGGMEGFITKLEETLAKSGKSFDDLKNTAQASIDRVKIQFEQLKGALGIPIVEELKEQFDNLFAALEGREDDLLLIADTFGRVAASIVEIVGTGLTDFLTNLDSEQVVEIGETIFDITQDIKLLGDLLLGVEFPSSFLDGVEAAATKIKELLETTTKLVLLAQAEAARNQAENEAAGAGARRNAFGQVNTALLSDEDRLRVAAAGQAAHDKVLTEGVGKMQEATKASEENREATDKRREAIEKAKDTSTADADALLGEARAAEALADAQEEATAAQAKIDEARAKAQKDYQQDLLEADIKFERARTDALLDGQRKREDAAKANLQKIADIEKKNKQGRTDSETDLDRDIEDIHRKHSREKIEQRKDEAQKIIDLETDTRRKISDIIDRSQIDLDEAEQRRDAVSFLRILKARNLDIAEAQKDTARAVQDTRTEGERKRDELKIQQQQEIADAKLANDRRLEDLQTALSRELEAQATAYDREREQIATNEARKLDDLVLARERDREDALRHYQEKLADLEISMAAELETIKKFHAMEEEEAARHAAAMAAAEAEAKRQTRREKVQSQANADDDTPSSRPGQQNRRRQRAGQANSRPGAINRGRAYGGLVNAGQPTPVGELGPELFVPNSNGRIIPSNQLILPSMTPKSSINNINSSRQQEINIPMVNGTQLLDAVFVAQLRNLILSEMGRVL